MGTIDWRPVGGVGRRGDRALEPHVYVNRVKITLQTRRELPLKRKSLCSKLLSMALGRYLQWLRRLRRRSEPHVMSFYRTLSLVRRKLMNKVR